MLASGTELITLTAGTNYEPTFISTDKRVPSGTPTTVGYWQIGELSQAGFARGPIFKIELADVSGVAATHIKIWGVDNKDNVAPIYPLAYFTSMTSPAIIDVYLKKFEFCNSAGVVASESNYLVVGYKKRVLPITW